MEKLDQVGATILGIVLNKVTRHTGRNYGYGYSYTYKPYQYSYKPNHAGNGAKYGAPEREQQGPGSQPAIIYGGISEAPGY